MSDGPAASRFGQDAPPLRLFAGQGEDDQYFRLMADAAPALLWVCDADRGRTWFNKSWLEFVGREMEHELGDGWKQNVHPDDLEARCATCRKAFDAREPFKVEYRLRRSDGQYRRIVDHGVPMHDATGAFIGYIGSVIDVDETHRADLQLRASRDVFMKLIQNAPFGVYLVDAEFRLAQVSAGSRRVFEGVSPLIGRDFAEVMRTIWREPFAGEAIARFRHTLETGEPYRCAETNERRADIDAVEAYDWRIERIVLPDGRHGVVCYFYELTSQREAERAMRESEQRFRAIADNISQLAWMCDATFANVIWYNQRWYDYTGTTFETMQGDGWKAVQHPERLPDVIAKVERANATGEPWEDTFPLRGRDGEYRWFLSRAVPIRDENGRIVRWFGTNTDVTDQLRAADALRESEERFRNIADAAPAKLWVTDPEGACTFVSRRWYDVTGQSPRTALGWGWLEALHPDDREAGRKQLIEATGRRKPFSVDWRFINVKGETRWGVCSGRPRFDDAGRFLGFIGSVVDITHHKLAEQKLQRLNEELEVRVAERTGELRALARELTQTEQRERKRLARIMHDEIQQLLAVAKMQASLAMDRREDPEPLRQVLRIVDEAIVACRALTVTLSPPVLRDADLGTSLQWLARYMADQHGLKIEVDERDAAAELPEDLRTLLFEITRELLFNVRKHAGVDEARVTLSRCNGEVSIEVADEGRGCNVETLHGAKVDSFGLLSIRERLIDLGGRLEADAAVGRGCRVRITAPYEVERAPDPPSFSGAIANVRTDIDSEPVDGVIRILLADDHTILRQGLAELLSTQPDTRVIAEASDGIEAVTLARKLRPDVVVMDINMPRLGGIEATRIIRRELPQVRVVGLSMHEREDLASAMLDAGAEAFLNKCGAGAELLSALRGEPTRRTQARRRRRDR